MSPFEVSIRTFFVATLGIAIVILLGRDKPISPSQPAMVRVSQRPTHREQSLPPIDQAKSGGKLLGGAIVIGALLAFVIAVLLAIVVTTVTNFLQ